MQLNYLFDVFKLAKKLLYILFETKLIKLGCGYNTDEFKSKWVTKHNPKSGWNRYQDIDS